MKAKPPKGKPGGSEPTPGATADDLPEPLDEERLDAPLLEHPDFRRPERGKDVQAQRLAVALVCLRLDRDRDLVKPVLRVSRH